MSDSHVTAHPPAAASAPHGSPADPFSAEEKAAFQKDDIEAAGNIVKLMVGIFSLGIVLYLIVAWSIVS